MKLTAGHKKRRVFLWKTRRWFFTKEWYVYWRFRMNVSLWISPNVSVLPDMEYATM